MAKKKTQLKNLGKQHVKDALVCAFPYLRKPYRELKKDELDSEEVFSELFKNEPLNLFKLRVVYAFQN